MCGGCPAEVKVNNPQEEVGSQDVGAYFIRYAENSKGYRFYCPTHTSRFVVSGSDQPQISYFEDDHATDTTPTSEIRLVICNDIYHDQLDMEQPFVEIPYSIEDVLVDPYEQQPLPEVAPMEQQPP